MKCYWRSEELHEHWSLSDEELGLAGRQANRGRRRSMRDRLVFAIMFKFFQYQGCFPSGIKELPSDTCRVHGQSNRKHWYPILITMIGMVELQYVNERRFCHSWILKRIYKLVSMMGLYAQSPDYFLFFIKQQVSALTCGLPPLLRIA